MNGINLLPWREAKRRARDRAMISGGIVIWILCILLVVAALSYIKINQGKQKARNEYLTVEIRKLEKTIKKVETLKAKKASLISRMEVIQGLQRQRTEVVHLFDQTVRKLPDGVYFSNLNKKSNRIKFKGQAQSNARVSELMNHLESSKWFHNSKLQVINVKPQGGTRVSQFDLGVTVSKPKNPTAEATN